MISLPRVKTSLGNSGFTLMEVLVGMAILGIVYATLFSLLSTSLRNLDRIEEQGELARRAQAKLNELVQQVSQGEASVPLSGQLDGKYQWNAQVKTFDQVEDSAKASIEVSLVRLSIYSKDRPEKPFALETLTHVVKSEKDKNVE